MRLLLSAITCEKGDVEGNLARHLEVIDEARDAGCSLAVFPEMSLTGSVDQIRRREHAIALEHDAITALAAAAMAAGVDAVVGIGEWSGDDLYIAQLLLQGGAVAGVQRKRHLGQGEEGFAIGASTARCSSSGVPFGIVICAESHVDFTWEASAGAGERLVFLCSAPGLDERCTDETTWRSGFDWWGTAGLADAQRQAKRLRLWVGMATQAGSTVDEDFPGIAALIDPNGEIVDRLPDWRPGTLVVDVPV